MSSVTSPSPTVNQAAFAAVTVTAASTIASVYAAVTAVSTLAIVVFSILAVTAAAAGIASMTARSDPTSTDAKSYFNNCQKHAGFAIAGAYQFVAQIFVQALVQGAADGIATSVRRRIAGEDQRVRFV